MIYTKDFHYLLIAFTLLFQFSVAQEIIPIDTTNFIINSKSYVIENHKGKNAIYIKNGGLILKNKKFKNGTIEFDMILKETQMFPGVVFRGIDNFNEGEQWFMRTHLSGKPDSNQAAPYTNGITPWQLYFGPKYSFPCKYKFNDWTHVRLVVNENKAQVFLDNSKEANLSWYLFHEPKEGNIYIRGGSNAIHIANIIVNNKDNKIVNFKPIETEKINQLIPSWEISDKFEEKKLTDIDNLKSFIKSRTWQGKIFVEEGKAANISRIQKLRNNKPGNTVFAKISIHSNKNQVKFFEFGYSDRIVAILNNEPIYKGTNKWRSRDYRYLGTIGLFDGIYLNLKKGENTLLMAVSEDFGGWLITGKFNDEKGIKIK